MRSKTNYLVGIGILVVIVFLVGMILTRGGSQSRLRSEASQITMPNATLVSEKYAKGSNCMDACPSLAVVFKFDPASAVSMEALLDSRMGSIGYGYVQGSTAPYTWTKGEFYAQYQWVTTSGQDATLPLGGQLVDELDLQIYDRAP